MNEPSQKWVQTFLRELSRIGVHNPRARDALLRVMLRALRGGRVST